MDKVLRFLALFHVVSGMVPAIMSTPHTKASTADGVIQHVNSLIEAGHLPEDMNDVTPEEVSEVLDAHPAVTFAEEPEAPVAPTPSKKKGNSGK
jgi:hypothetical protein